MRLNLRSATPPDLHLHLLDLDADTTAPDRLEAQAGHEACARAARLATPQRRRRLLVREAQARRLVGERLSRPAREVRIARAPGGRPSVEGSGLALSLSQSKGLALVALADGGDVGCDIEHLDAPVGWRDALGADVLTEEEVRRLAGLPEPQAQALFLRMWTLKEAGLKCLGVGLSVPARSMRTCGPVSYAGGSEVSLPVFTPRLHPECACAVAWRFNK